MMGVGVVIIIYASSPPARPFPRVSLSLGVYGALEEGVPSPERSRTSSA